VSRPEHWPWSSAAIQQIVGLVLSGWPVQRPRNWLDLCCGADDAAELEELRACVRRDTPYGDRVWASRVGMGTPTHTKGSGVLSHPAS
jgi:hypothetical protein